MKLSANKIHDLQLKALKVVEGDLSLADIKICKHVPHVFEWKELDPDQMVTVKEKKKSKQHRAGDLDIKKPPILLRDGDHIGVLVLGQAGAAEDDLQTEADRIAAEEFRVMKEEERKRKEQEKKNKNLRGGARADGASVRIMLDEDEEDARALAMAIEESKQQAAKDGVAVDAAEPPSEAVAGPASEPAAGNGGEDAAPSI